MSDAEQLAGFISKADYEQLSYSARRQLKSRVLDALGCAIGAIGNAITKVICDQIHEFGGASLCTLIGGARTAPDRAALYNSALVRYLDFNDSYLAKKETCHPSDNLGSILAGSEYADSTGRDFLTALAVAYQIQCRLSDAAPVRDKGFDHTTQGSYAIAGGVSKALRLDQERTTNALAIAGTAFNALRVTRTGKLSNWKGLAYPNTAFCATHATFLAMRGISSPLEVFEGNKGFMDAISGHFEIDWSKEDLECVTRTIIKLYNAEIHAQSAIDGVVELRNRQGIHASAIERVEVEIFEVAFRIIGGGEEGDKSMVETKEQADHSLPYLIAVALLDGQVLPEQYSPERIKRDDVQSLLRRVHIRPAQDLSDRFPQELPCRIRVMLKDGKDFSIQKNDYEGFVTSPMSWERTIEKFNRLSQSHTDVSIRNQIIETVDQLEMKRIRDLTDLLGRVVEPKPTEALQYGG